MRLFNLFPFAAFLLMAVIALPLAAYSNEDDQESLEALLQTDIELKAEVGSRSGEKNMLDANAPVDVITAKQIEQSGLHSLTHVLRYYIAGFNAPETSVADGSDHVRAFTLRGMAPDQVLVLVNGKRLHSAALLHVNGVIGRGSSGVDLDTIALKAIERVEILRDGAAAQYGSDAIAGVINIVLKGMGQKSSLSINSGVRSKRDGKLIQGEGMLVVPLPYDGFINATLSADRQQQTWRGGPDPRLATPRIDTHVGIPAATNYKAVIHTEIPLRNGLMPYVTALGNQRDSRASAFYRPPSVSNTMLYPNGFLPEIKAKITDYTLMAGIKGEWGDGLSWELSQAYGSNKFDFSVNNSMNYTLAGASPMVFDNGGLQFIQQTTNLDFKQHRSAWDLALGAEYRSETYQITAGNVASYTGSASQGFAGFRPENAVRDGRTTYALYGDASYRFVNTLSVEAAVRSERYSDFGMTTNMKLAATYKPMPTLMFRTGFSTGFRAPSLSQLFYSQTSSFVDTVTNTLTTQGTFRPNDPVAIALGAKPLNPEKSRHASIGTVFQPSKHFSLMVDYFYTLVDDRITLSNDLAGATVAQAAILTANHVRKARFFVNGLTTTTQGIDVRINQAYILAHQDKLSLGLWFNYNRNHVTKFKGAAQLHPTGLDQIDRLENGQPKSSIKLLTQYQHNDWDLVMNFNRFGGYKQVIGNTSYAFDAKWTTDLNVTYTLSPSVRLAVGGSNIFDVTPNKWKGLSGNFYGNNGIKPYSRYSPFGYSGAYYYARLMADF
ncbi:MAG: TonB-dependent receptor [Mariprofundaceae bacterium]|nr:TonB-dependent receptor [Mariprofundaceae bacterium]